MNRASGTCGTTVNDLVFIFLKSEFQKEREKRLRLKKYLNKYG